MYIKKSLRDWFKIEYRQALEFTSICHRNRIYNIDEKGAKIACLAREEVSILIRIKEMYIRVP